MSLHNGSCTIDVNYKSGKIVALAMYKSESVSVGIVCKYDFTQIKCFFYAVVPEIGINFFVLE